MKIPPQHLTAVKDFLGLSKQSIKKFIGALEQAPPTLLVPDLAKYVDEKAKLGPKRTRKIVEMLASLYTLHAKENIPIEDLVEEFRLASEKEHLEPKSEPWDRFKTYLAKILSFDQSLGVTSKAADVMTQHAIVFRNAQVLTDLRPVFKSDPKEPPAAAVIIHTLKIVYRESGFRKEFFVAMDSNDLTILQELLNRANLKEMSLKSLAKKSGLLCLEVK
jgi:hypothetical protein